MREEKEETGRREKRKQRMEGAKESKERHI